MKSTYACCLVLTWCLATTVFAGQDHGDANSFISANEAAYSQYPLAPGAATYRIDTGGLGGLLGKAMKGDSDLGFIFTLTRESDDNFRFSYEATASRRVVPGVGKPLEKSLFESVSLIDAKASVYHENSSGSTNEQNDVLTVSLESSPILGTNQVIRLQNEKGIKRELMVGPDEPITTLFQIAVFAGTLEHIPPEGINVRWVIDGMPNPVLIRQSPSEHDEILVFRAEPDQAQSIPEPILRFIFPNDRQGFSLPEKMVLVTDGMELSLSREKE